MCLVSFCSLGLIDCISQILSIMVYFNFVIESVCDSKWAFMHLDLFGIISALFINF